MNILLHFRHFPVAMGRFFDWGLKDLGYKVFTVGPYTGGKIPWGEHFNYPKYRFPPDYILPDGNVSIEAVLKRIPFKPDVIIQAADTIYLTGPSPVPNIVIATDPHAVDYSDRIKYASLFFSMQNCYLPSAHWLPYAYEPAIHKYLPKIKQEFDVVFSGLQYQHRILALMAMKNNGLRVENRFGLIYEGYVEFYNKGKIAFVWSSKDDLPARFWEGLAMRRLVLTYRVPDLKKLEFVDGIDYVGFDNLEEAIQKAKFYTENDEAREKIALSGWKKVQPHTYQARCKNMMEVLKKWSQ